MTAITQCPACGTLFRVVEDQLRVSQGWVRCGQCHDVFDAQLSLRGEAEIHAPDMASHASRPSESSALIESTFAAMQLDSPMEPVTKGTNVDFHTGAAPEVSAALTPVEPIVPPVVAPNNGRAPEVKAPRLDATASTPALDLQPMPQVSFIQPPAASMRRWVAWMWAFACLVFMLILVAQFAWHERSRIAAHHPAVEPTLAAMCLAIGCKVEPLRAVDAIVIDSFAITEIGAAGYRLTFNLRSNAPTLIAAPSVELSLQDAQEQTVLKRVFGPSDIGLLKATMPANSEHAANVVFTLREPNGSASKRIAGYRLFAFYP